MGRYVRGSDSWTIERDGRTLTIDGVVETLADDKLAATRFNVLVNQKLRAGYKLWKPPVDDNPPLLPDAPAVYDARNPELEAAILADPDAKEPYIVYGDWLQQQGDPRGELIARYAQLVASPQRDPRLEQSIGARLHRFRDYFYGGLQLGDGQRVAFAWGFISRIELERTPYNRSNTPVVLRRILGIASARFVRAIELVAGDTGETDKAVRVIGKHAPPTLRGLALRGNDWLHDLSPIADRLPALRELAVTAKVTPNTSWFDTLIAAPLPQLASLELELGAGDANVERVRPLLHRDLPKLRTLILRAELDDALFDTLASAPIAAQIEDLSLPRIQRETADRLPALVDAMPKLTALSVHQLHVPKEIWAALARRVPELEDWSERYDSIDE